MGFIVDKVEQFGGFVGEKVDQFGNFVGEQVDNFTGVTAAEAAKEAAAIQAASGAEAIATAQAAGEEAQTFFDPFAAVGQQGVDQAGFLTDPNAQFDFLQNNPLFKAALDNANRQTSQRAASQGRLAAGDTFTDLAGNTLLAASPLISNQKQSILDLLGIGSNTATSKANTAIGVGTNVANQLTNIGDVNAAGVIGEANALTQGTENIFDLGIQTVGAFAGGGSTPTQAPVAPVGSGSNRFSGTVTGTV